MHCPACGNQTFASVYRNTVFYRPRDVLLCEACRLYLLSPFPDDEELVEYYRSQYSRVDFTSPLRSPMALMKLLYADMRAKSQHDFISKSVSLGPSARVIDLGCSTGNLLRRFLKRGCTTCGVELGKSSAAYASSRYGLDVLQLNIHEALDRIGEGVDLFILSHTLEHLDDPTGVLSKCFALLREGGSLFIELPNSYTGPGAGESWEEFSSVLLNSDHVFNFSTRNMGLLLGRCGFRVKRMNRLLSQRTFPLLDWMGASPKVDHIYTRRKNALQTYSPVLLNTLYLGLRYLGNRETAWFITNGRPWAGTNEWLRIIAEKSPGERIARKRRPQ